MTSVKFTNKSMAIFMTEILVQKQNIYSHENLSITKYKKIYKTIYNMLLHPLLTIN